jgi:hypothetical protein
MITSQYNNRHCLGRRLFLVLIIACLCFSAGEGLRLRPFPVFEREECQEARAQLDGDISNEIGTRYNPTIVPTRPLKRGKQQVVEYRRPPSHVSFELTAHSLRFPVTSEEVSAVSLLLISRIPSRAPPFGS